jgi:VanZ family protein
MIRDVPRWWWAVAAAAVAAFAAYISLVPFDFVRPPAGVTLIHLLQTRVETRIGSDSNLLANAVMFAPFGFFGTGALVNERSRALRWVAAVLVVLVTSVLLSCTIEFLQIFVPGRTPSVIDVSSQLAGTLGGVAAWAVLGREVRTWSVRFAAGSRSALELVLAMYAAVRFLLFLQPMDVTVELSDLAHKFRAGGIVLDPLRSPLLHGAMLPSVLSDLLLAVPIGVLAVIARNPRDRRRGAAPAMAFGVLFFLLAEMARVFIRSQTADAADLLLNCLGMAVGVAITSALVPHRATPADLAADTASSHRGLLGPALVAAALLYAAYNWSPFDFTFSRGFVADRLSALGHVPFESYYVNSISNAVTQIVTKVMLALPLGALFQLWIRPERTAYRRSITAIWLAATALFFTAIEVGQALLPSRYPDNTDIILAVAGVWIGMQLVRPFQATKR